jgi:AAA15 family ATPase/GTPase
MIYYPLSVSIKAKNYKCFGEKEQGFEVIKPINLIIGRNNSGKSALLDLIKYLTSPYDLSNSGHKGNNPEIFFSSKLTTSDISRAFAENYNIREFGNLNQYGQKYLGKEIVVKLRIDPNGRLEKSFLSVGGVDLSELNKYESQFAIKRNLSNNLTNPFENKSFKKIGAERDIRPEAEDGNLFLQDNGTGATNIVQAWLNDDNKNASLIETELLNELNEIFGPDGVFTRILVKKKRNGYWEIYLEESNKGLVSLSDSGSGLKTIILVLLNTIILPKQDGRNLNQYVFAFEELENNLHPALLRRLLAYITRLQKTYGCGVLLTTHSSTTIDFLGKNEDTQIIHVRNDGTCATAKSVLGYVDSIEILDDLEVRASDVLQSNGIIWVEGPSDRVYIKKWVDLWSEGKLEEGVHYQCLMYGGKLLSHLSADDPSKVDGLISILRANRNLILMMDSDKDDAQATLNTTKTRLIEEVEKMKGVAWVTNGREIENYIPPDALRILFGNTGIIGPGQFTKFEDYIKRTRSNSSESFDKVKFANEISPLFKKNDLEKILDLKEKMTIVCEKIKNWNGLH